MGLLSILAPDLLRTRKIQAGHDEMLHGIIVHKRIGWYQNPCEHLLALL